MTFRQKWRICSHDLIQIAGNEFLCMWWVLFILTIYKQIWLDVVNLNISWWHFYELGFVKCMFKYFTFVFPPVCWRSKWSHGEYQYALWSPRFTYTPECQLRPQSPPKRSPRRGPQHFHCRGDGAPPRQRNSETKLHPVQWCHNRLAHSQTQ